MIFLLRLLLHDGTTKWAFAAPKAVTASSAIGADGTLAVVSLW